MKMKACFVVIIALSALSAQAQIIIDSDQTEIVSELGQSQEVQLTITPPEKFTGKMKLEVVSGPDEKMTGKETVKILLSPSVIDVVDGAVQYAGIDVDVGSMALDFVSEIEIKATFEGSDEGSESSVSLKLPLKVIPTFHVFMNGPFVDGKKGENFSIPQGETVKFAAHKDGVTVNFVNMDKKKEHYVHAQGAIPHQSGPFLKPYPGDGTGKDITYTYVVKSTKPNDTALFYCHEHEGSVYGRKLVFNVAP